MVDIQIHVGMKLTDANGINWRIMVIGKAICILIMMNSTKRVFRKYDSSDLLLDIYKENMIIAEDQEIVVVDFDRFTEKMKADYDRKGAFIHEVDEAYGPEFIEFINSETKPKFTEICEKYGFCKMQANRILLRWWQSGMQLGSWADQRSLPIGNKKEKVYTKKTGPKHDDKSGVVITDEVKEQFDYGIKLYKKNKKITKMDAYANVLYRYYTDENLVLVPPEQYPTFRQFYYYFSRQISSIDQKRIKTSRDEFYNDHRALFGFNRESAVKPGYIVEVDALEMDIYIVSTFNHEQAISRPIIYMMTDLYSHAIVAFHVGFDNNSMLGLSSLMMNLFDNKETLLKEHGITNVDTRYWPSCFIPHEIRCDRGSDFASDQFGKICQDLGIVRTLEHGATGSMKGLIEQSFRQFQQETLPLLERQGVMLKRYDSNHKREACLRIEDIFELLVAFIIRHNRQTVQSFSLTKDMREKGVRKNSISIWEYGKDHDGIQQQVNSMNYQNCLFHTLPTGDAGLCREGVRFRGLLYRCNLNDRDLINSIMLSQVNGGRRNAKGEKLNTFPIRYDPRSIDEVYYFKDGHIEMLHLDSNKNDGLEHITWEEYEDYRTVRLKMKKEGIAWNMQDRVTSIGIVSDIAARAVTPTYADATNIRAFRKLDRNELNYNNRVSSRFEDELPEAGKYEEGSETLEDKTEKKSTKAITAKKPAKTDIVPKSDTDDIDDETCPDELCDFL